MAKMTMLLRIHKVLLAKVSDALLIFGSLRHPEALMAVYVFAKQSF